jgi:hypothetical protein
VDAEQVLAFRLARSGLAARDARTLAGAAACPASDFSRDAALLALAARHDGVTRAKYDEAVDEGDLVAAHIVRGAIHVLAPGDHALFGRALLAGDDDELGAQLGQQVQRLAAEKAFKPTEALDEVAEATTEALRGGRALDRTELHAALRERVGADLMPWCKSCKSHHVAPMLWRFAAVKAATRLDAQRRYRLGKPGRTPATAGAVERFLRFYGPSDAKGLAAWAGLAPAHAKRLWGQVADDLAEVAVGKSRLWALRADLEQLESPPAAEGIRLLPPNDPYLQTPNRPLLAPEPELRKRLFRPVASPGVVLSNGRLVGLWRVRAKGKRTEITVEKLARVARAGIEAEAQRVADLRGDAGLVLAVDWTGRPERRRSR